MRKFTDSENKAHEEYKEKMYKTLNLTDKVPGSEEDNVESLKKFLEFQKENGGVMKIPHKFVNCRTYIEQSDYKIVSKLTEDVEEDIIKLNKVDYVLIEAYKEKV